MVIKSNGSRTSIKYVLEKSSVKIVHTTQHNVLSTQELQHRAIHPLYPHFEHKEEPWTPTTKIFPGQEQNNLDVDILLIHIKKSNS